MYLQPALTPNTLCRIRIQPSASLAARLNVSAVRNTPRCREARFPRYRRNRVPFRSLQAADSRHPQPGMKECSAAGGCSPRDAASGRRRPRVAAEVPASVSHPSAKFVTRPRCGAQVQAVAGGGGRWRWRTRRDATRRDAVVSHSALRHCVRVGWRSRGLAFAWVAFAWVAFAWVAFAWRSRGVRVGGVRVAFARRSRGWPAGRLDGWTTT